MRDDTAERLRGRTASADRFRARYDGVDDDGDRGAVAASSGCAGSCSRPSGGAVLALRNAGMITDDVMHRVQRDLDLEDSRLDV